MPRFFPPNAALMVAILVLPPRLGLCTCLACFCANIVMNRITNAMGVYPDFLYSALNVGVGYGAAFLTRSLCGAATDLARARRMLMFVAISFVSAGVEALVGDLLDPNSAANGGLLQNWFQWTLCDALGLLLCTPSLLLAIKSRNAVSSGARALERWCLLGGICVLCLLAFALARSPLLLMLYPALLLIAFRAGPAWVLASVLLTCFVASAMTAHGYGPLALLSANGSGMREDMMQPYLISLFLAAVPANNALQERRRTAERLAGLREAREQACTHDALTALANRDLFRRRLAAMLQAGTVRAVLFIDLDRFKQVNDTFGHQAGDELLRRFAARLAGCVPEDGMVARFGGDEFAVLLADTVPMSGVSKLCRDIERRARAPFELTRGLAHISATIGVANVAAETCEAAELMRRADIALYAAKAAGRNCSRVFSEDLDRKVQETAALEVDLRAALAGAGGLALHYQLKFDPAGAPRAVEALLRWNHPRHGPVAPSRFVAVAEETGLILPLGAWVFREALAFAARWPWLHVAINVSPIQLRHPEMVADMLHALRCCGVEAGRIEIEVTETVFLDETSPAMTSLRLLREAGLRIALDDFGTGYSSMRQLQRFKIDRLKIDQSFIASLGQGPGPAAIVDAIISLGHAMGLQVTAEGIETQAQRDFLVDAGVDELQGYFFSRPADEKTLALALAPPRLTDAKRRKLESAT